MQKFVERGCDKNACLQILQDSQVKSFSRSTFSDLYQGTYSTVFVTVTSKQNGSK